MQTLNNRLDCLAQTPPPLPNRKRIARVTCHQYDENRRPGRGEKNEGYQKDGAKGQGNHLDRYLPNVLVLPPWCRQGTERRVGGR